MMRKAVIALGVLIWMAGLALVVIVAGMIYRGDVWAFIIYVERPYSHLFAGLGCMLAGFYILKGHRYSAAQWRGLAGRWALLIFSTLLCAVIGELGIRHVLLTRQASGSINNLQDERAMDKTVSSDNPHPLAAIVNVSTNLKLVFELRPDLDMKFGHKQLKTNRYGMRANVDHSQEKPADTVRVIGIGDSGMFGWNVHQGEEYLAVLEEILNRRNDGLRYEVLNLAVPGYNTQLEVESLVAKGLAFEPDIVLLGWCINDYQLPFFMLEPEDFTRRDVSFVHLFLFRRKEIGNLVAGRRVTSMRGYNRDRLEHALRDGAGVEGVQAAMHRLKNLSDDIGFQVLVCGPLEPRVLEIINAAGLPYFNTYEKINANDYPKELAVHYMHPAPGGHSVIGEAIARELNDRGWLQGGP